MFYIIIITIHFSYALSRPPGAVCHLFGCGVSRRAVGAECLCTLLHQLKNLKQSDGLHNIGHAMVYPT